MHGAIGRWDGEVAVAFGPEMLRWLDGHGTDRYVRVIAVCSYDDDLGFAVLPSREGTENARRVHRCGPTNSIEYRVVFEESLCCPPEHLSHLPRFEIHTVDFDSEDGSCAIGWLEAAHLLPWPRARNCGSYSIAEVLGRDIYLRLRSALKADAKTLGAPLPDRLRANLPAGLWARELNRAKADHAAEAAPRKLAA